MIEQVTFIEYLTLRGALFTATVGGVRLSIGQATALKRQGYSKGVPDILIFEPRGKYHGLMIEMKRQRIKGEPRGRVSPDQERWKEQLLARGYRSEVCEGFDEAKGVYDAYMA